MITRNQYLDALELIDKYHRQSAPTNRILITDFVAENPGVTPKIANILRGSYKIGSEYRRFVYMDELTKSRVLQVRGVGTRSWKELQGYITRSK